jgi:hypothetical protein
MFCEKAITIADLRLPIADWLHTGVVVFVETLIERGTLKIGNRK